MNRFAIAILLLCGSNFFIVLSLKRDRTNLDTKIKICTREINQLRVQVEQLIKVQKTSSN
jgi:hypothetical protein